MKKLITMAVALFLIVLGACGTQQQGDSYERAMRQGMSAVRAEKYEQASSYFKSALKAKANDRKATVLLAQVSGIRNAQAALKNNSPDKAVQAAEAVLLQKNGSGLINKTARHLKEQAEQTSGQVLSDRSGSSAAESGAGSDSGSSSESSTAASVVSSGNGSGGSASHSSIASPASSKATSGRVDSAQAAIAAVTKAAGYQPNRVYADVTDKGAYYAVELRENHSGDSAADPDTAPSIGFFRYYKQTGRITELNIITNQYKDVK